MKKIYQSILCVACRPYELWVGKVPKDRPVPIDVAHVVASACRHGGAEGSFQF